MPNYGPYVREWEMFSFTSSGSQRPRRALAWVVTRPKPPPYVFEVNNQGEYVGKIEPLTGTNAVPEAIILTNIDTFVGNAFRIASDQGEERSFMDAAHAVLANQANSAMGAFYFGKTGRDKTNNPL